MKYVEEIHGLKKSNVQCPMSILANRLRSFQASQPPRKPADRTLDFGLTKDMLDRVNIPIEETRSYHISAGGAERFFRNGVGHTKRSHSCTLAGLNSRR